MAILETAQKLCEQRMLNTGARVLIPRLYQCNNTYTLYIYNLTYSNKEIKAAILYNHSNIHITQLYKLKYNANLIRTST